MAPRRGKVDAALTVTVLALVLAASIAVYSLTVLGREPSSRSTASIPPSSVGTSEASNGTASSLSASGTTSSLSASEALNSSETLSSTGSTSTSYGLPTSVSNGTSWFGAEGATGSCSNETIDATFTGDGYTLKAYLTPTPHGDGLFAVGSTVCIHTYLVNSENQSASPPSAETVKITSVVNEASSGIVFYESRCSVPGSHAAPFGPSSPGWNCVSGWDTSKTYGGSQPAGPGAYEAIVTISLANSYAVQVVFSMDLVASTG